jgi:3-dehydroquinate synthetase
LGSPPASPTLAGPIADELLAHMAHKKARNGKLTLILSKGIGKAYIQRDADIGPLRQFLAKEAVPAS